MTAKRVRNLAFIGIVLIATSAFGLYRALT